MNTSAVAVCMAKETKIEMYIEFSLKDKLQFDRKKSDSFLSKLYSSIFYKLKKWSSNITKKHDIATPIKALCVFERVHSTQKRTQITNQIKLAKIKNP